MKHTKLIEPINEAQTYSGWNNAPLEPGFYVCVDTDYNTGEEIAYIGTEEDAQEAQNSSEGYVIGPFDSEETARQAAQEEGVALTESKTRKRAIRLTESQLHNVIKESVRRIVNEVQYNGKSYHGDNPEDWNELRKIRRNNGRNDDKNRRAMFRNSNNSDEVSTKMNQGMIPEVKQKLIQAIKDGRATARVSYYSGSTYASFSVKCSDGSYFYCDDIEVDLVIDEYPYYEPRTWDHPEEYGDAEGHAEFYDSGGIIAYYENENDDYETVEFEIDSEIAKALDEYVEYDDDSMSDAIYSKLEAENDYGE